MNSFQCFWKICFLKNKLISGSADSDGDGVPDDEDY